MSLLEETMDATLDSNGQLRLSNQSQLPPGPVCVTIRVTATGGPKRGLADVKPSSTLAASPDCR